MVGVEIESPFILHSLLEKTNKNRYDIARSSGIFAWYDLLESHGSRNQDIAFDHHTLKNLRGRFAIARGPRVQRSTLSMTQPDGRIVWTMRGQPITIPPWL